MTITQTGGALGIRGVLLESLLNSRLMDFQSARGIPIHTGTVAELVTQATEQLKGADELILDDVVYERRKPTERQAFVFGAGLLNVNSRPNDVVHMAEFLGLKYVLSRTGLLGWVITVEGKPDQVKGLERWFRNTSGPPTLNEAVG